MTNEPQGWVQDAMVRRAPELNALHMETLAYSIGSTLSNMPPAFFDEVAAIARKMGPERLAQWHQGEVLAA